MLEWDFKKKIIAIALSVGIVFTIGFYFVAIFQPSSKTDEIYKSALEDYNKGDYQNAYYLFSKITVTSKLKPVAIYHRAECAKMLGDDKSEVKQYEILFNNYPKHVLSTRARYFAGQRLLKDKPQVSKKYFEYIIKEAPNSDYAVASEYYLGVILKNKYKNAKIVPQSVKNEIQNSFRHYLKQAPSGRLALNAVNNWLEVSDKIAKDDYLLMANTCYLFGEYEQAQELLKHTDLTESWALDVKISNAMKNSARVKALTEKGLQSYSNYVSEDDIIDAIDIYTQNSKSQPVDRLLSFATGKGRDYLLSQKCQSEKDNGACYSKLYLQYPNGRFSADALANIFFAKIKAHDIETAKKIGHDHLNKFPNVNSTPMVMFWLGKISEKSNNYEEYSNYYKNVIAKYPDSYYAYRAYLKLNHMQGALITNSINKKPILYPYKYTRNNIIVKLVDLGDYDIINEFAGDDDFIKSWVLYKKGDYSRSMLTARDAMEKIENKPDKHDLRWRLVYPVMYYDDVKKFSAETRNSMPLMLGLIREESYFDPLAQSAVGASGLMQLMPSTASEINNRYGLGMNISTALFNPYSNIKLGNYYYEFLRQNLDGYDVSSVVAYNGGIGSIKKWKTSLRYNDTDEFVEQIPYPETKNYVKKVFRSYWNYVRIYSGND
jgi:tetratricopeptide (TPR) repeat protein